MSGIKILRPPTELELKRLNHLQRWIEGVGLPMTVRFKRNNPTRFVFEYDTYARGSRSFREAKAFLAGVTDGWLMTARTRLSGTISSIIKEVKLDALERKGLGRQIEGEQTPQGEERKD